MWMLGYYLKGITQFPDKKMNPYGCKLKIAWSFLEYFLDAQKFYDTLFGHPF